MKKYKKYFQVATQSSICKDSIQVIEVLDGKLQRNTPCSLYIRWHGNDLSEYDMENELGL